MGDVIAFRPKPREDKKAVPDEVNDKIKKVISEFPFETVASLYSKTTVDNLKLQAVRGLLEAYEKHIVLGAICPTVECDNFNCTYEHLSTGPEFYLDYVVASAYSSKRTRWST